MKFKEFKPGLYAFPHGDFDNLEYDIAIKHEDGSWEGWQNDNLGFMRTGTSIVDVFAIEAHARAHEWDYLGAI
jgi:hypothetical protein